MRIRLNNSGVLALAIGTPGVALGPGSRAVRILPVVAVGVGNDNVPFVVTPQLARDALGFRVVLCAALGTYGGREVVEDGAVVLELDGIVVAEIGRASCRERVF